MNSSLITKTNVYYFKKLINDKNKRHNENIINNITLGATIFLKLKLYTLKKSVQRIYI